MTDLGWIVVNRWEDFQHLDTTRSSRGAPAWIKNYTRLMDDDEYLSLTPHTVAVLHRLWLLYAKSRCALRADTGMLSNRLGLRVTKYHLESLNHAGFIGFSARKPHVDGTQDARPTRAGEEVEREINPKDVREGAEGERPQDFTHELNGAEPSEMPELEQPASELVESDNDPAVSLADRLSKGIPF